MACWSSLVDTASRCTRRQKNRVGQTESSFWFLIGEPCASILLSALAFSSLVIMVLENLRWRGRMRIWALAPIIPVCFLDPIGPVANG